MQSAFRLTVKEFGAGLVCAEMISDKGIVDKNEKTMNMLDIDEREKPLSLQILAVKKRCLWKRPNSSNADIIGINMGCPVKKIIRCEAGARWLLDPNKIYDMVAAVVDPVKMRIGRDDRHIFAVENAQAVEPGGAGPCTGGHAFKCMKVMRIGILYGK